MDTFAMQTEASLERTDVANIKTEPYDETYEKYENEHARVSSATNDVSSCHTNNSACSNVVVNGESKFCFEEYKVLFDAKKHLTNAVCEDKYIIIGKLYAVKMRSIICEQQFFVEKLIDQIFHEALLENLDKNTILCNEPATIPLEAINSESESTFQSLSNKKPAKNSKNLVCKDAIFNMTPNNFIIGSQTKSCFCLEKKNIINNMKELNHKKSSDKFDVLGEFYATKLRSIPKHQKFYAEKLFNDVLLYGEFRQLNSTTCLIRSFKENHLRLRNNASKRKAANTESLKLTTFRRSNEGLKTLVNSAGLLLNKFSRRLSNVSRKSLSFSTSATLDLPLKQTYSKKLKISAAKFKKNKNSQLSDLPVKTLKRTSAVKRKLPASVTNSNLCTVKDTLVTSSCDLKSASAISNDIVELSFSISRESSPIHTIINIENQTSLSSSSNQQSSSSATIQFSDPPSNSDNFINLSIKEENISDSECNQQETASKQHCSKSCLPINPSTTSLVDTNTLLPAPSQLSSANTHLQLFMPCTNLINSTLHPHPLSNTFQNHQGSVVSGDSVHLTIKKEPTSDIHPSESILQNPSPKENDPHKNLVSNAPTTSSKVVQSQCASANPPLPVLTSCTNTLPSILSSPSSFQPFSSPYFIQMHPLPVPSNNSVNISTKPSTLNDSLSGKSKQLNTSSEQKQSNRNLAQNVSSDSFITTNASLSVPSQFASTNPTLKTTTSNTNSMPSNSSSYCHSSPYIFQVLQAPAFPVQLSGPVPMQLSEQNPAPTQLSGQHVGPIQLNGQSTTPVPLHGQHTAPIQYVTYATNPYLMQRFLKPS